MPAGGGHHGGGGGGGHHGGGHHHGGHHHGGHHHGGHHFGHNNYHIHGHNRYYARRHMGPLYYSPFRWFYRGIVLLVFVVLVGFILFAVGVTNFFSGPSVNSVVASPQDYRLLSYSQGSCGSIDVSTSQDRYPVLLYLFYQIPALTDGDSIQLSNTWYLSRREYKYHNYYLLTGSTASLSVYVASSSVKVMILTKSQFKKFDKDDYHSSELSTTCSNIQSSNPCQYTYDVNTDDEYYFILDAPLYSTTTVHHTLDIQKKIFVIDPSNIYSNCTATCSRSVPPSPTLFAMVRTGDPAGTAAWTDGVDYTWQCTSAFSIPAWVYLLIFTGVIVVLISVVAVIVTVVILYYRKKSANTGSVERDPLVTSAATLPTAPLNSYQPPPINPSSYQPPPVNPNSYQPPPVNPPSYQSPPNNPNLEPPPSYGWVDKN